VTPAATRRTLAAVVTVWVVGLLLVLGMWQRVDAACDAEPTAEASVACSQGSGLGDTTGR
jgi:hypothetical protein